MQILILILTFSLNLVAQESGSEDFILDKVLDLEKEKAKSKGKTKQRTISPEEMADELELEERYVFQKLQEAFDPYDHRNKIKLDFLYDFQKFAVKNLQTASNSSISGSGIGFDFLNQVDVNPQWDLGFRLRFQSISFKPPTGRTLDGDNQLMVYASALTNYKINPYFGFRGELGLTREAYAVELNSESAALKAALAPSLFLGLYFQIEKISGFDFFLLGGPKFLGPAQLGSQKSSLGIGYALGFESAVHLNKKWRLQAGYRFETQEKDVTRISQSFSQSIFLVGLSYLF